MIKVYIILNYLSCNTQVKFGCQLFDTTRGDDGKTERVIHWLPVPLAFYCGEENGEHNSYTLKNPIKAKRFKAKTKRVISRVKI